jgi:adenylate kinase family enzyme
MKLTVTLANTSVDIRFDNGAHEAEPFCRYYFNGFTGKTPSSANGANVRVRLTDRLPPMRPIPSPPRRAVYERLLTASEVGACLERLPMTEVAHAADRDIIGAQCLSGLLLYDPVSSCGEILLDKERSGCFRPLHRLLWMYMAQVLSNRNSCFVHCAALETDGKGDLFWGDSGAGKSTLASTVAKAAVLSDDSPVLVFRNGAGFVGASPFHQLERGMANEEGSTDRLVGIGGFYFLVQDCRTFLERLPERLAVARIVQRHVHFFAYLSADAKKRIFNAVFQTCSAVPCFTLHFALGDDVWQEIKKV